MIKLRSLLGLSSPRTRELRLGEATEAFQQLHLRADHFRGLQVAPIHLREAPVGGRYFSLETPDPGRLRLRLATQDIAFQEVAGRTRIYLLHGTTLPNWRMREDVGHAGLYLPGELEDAEARHTRLGFSEVIDQLTREIRNSSQGETFDFSAIRTVVDISPGKCAARLHFADWNTARGLLKEPDSSWSHIQLPLKIFQTWEDGAMLLRGTRAQDSDVSRYSGPHLTTARRPPPVLPLASDTSGSRVRRRHGQNWHRW